MVRAQQELSAPSRLVENFNLIAELDPGIYFQCVAQRYGGHPFVDRHPLDNDLKQHLAVGPERGNITLSEIALLWVVRRDPGREYSGNHHQR